MRMSIASSVFLTGLLFGILHGAQLSWTWGIVSLLILVGITFTYVRARTGTVFASYLMHLGYNSLIAFVSIIGTHGFTKMPPHP
jgi:membrane protease YdiL (CAAX protease family)